MPFLDNQRHEHFCRAIARGMCGAEAYRKVYGKEVSGAKQMASELLQRPEIVDRVQDLMEASETEHILTMQERRRFIARVVRADLTNLDLEVDGDLIQEITRTEGTKDRAGIEKFKLPGKLESVMADAKLAGDLTEKSEITHSGDPSAPLIVDLPSVVTRPRPRAAKRETPIATPET